jgi:hypothetical protein
MKVESIGGGQAKAMAAPVKNRPKNVEDPEVKVP